MPSRCPASTTLGPPSPTATPTARAGIGPGAGTTAWSRSTPTAPTRPATPPSGARTGGCPSEPVFVARPGATGRGRRRGPVGDPRRHRRASRVVPRGARRRELHRVARAEAPHPVPVRTPRRVRAGDAGRRHIDGLRVVVIGAGPAGWPWPATPAPGYSVTVMERSIERAACATPSSTRASGSTSAATTSPRTTARSAPLAKDLGMRPIADRSLVHQKSLDVTPATWSTPRMSSTTATQVGLPDRRTALLPVAVALSQGWSGHPATRGSPAPPTS